MSHTCLLSIVSLLFCSPGLQLLSAFASHRTAGKESPAELVKKEEGGETKGAPPQEAGKQKEKKVLGIGRRLVREHAYRCLPSPSLRPSQLFIIPQHLFGDRDMKANCRPKAGMRALGSFVHSLTSPLCPWFPQEQVRHYSPCHSHPPPG